MMKQIFNWTIGSFFRSIGRIVAYVVIGGFIAYMVNRGGYLRNIKLTDLLGIENVSALALDGNYRGITEVANSGHTMALTNNYPSDTWNFNTPYTNNLGYEYLVFSWSGYYGVEQEVDSTSLNYNLDVERFGITFNLLASNGYGSYNTKCEVQGNMIICPMYANAIYNQLSTYIYYGSTYTQSDISIRILINQYPMLYDNDTSSITNAQHETTNAITSMNQTISDTNTTSDTSSASTFFGDYNETATDGVSAIVSMPLNIFNALTTGSTKDLCFTLKGKQSCFPSGAILWNKSTRSSVHVGNSTLTPHPFSDGGSLSTGLSAFKILFNVVVSGFLGYKMLKSIMRIVNDMLNPTRDKVEVLEL